MTNPVNLECNEDGPIPRLAVSETDMASTVPELLAELHSVAANRHDELNVKASQFLYAVMGPAGRKPVAEWTAEHYALSLRYNQAIGGMIEAFQQFQTFAWLNAVAPHEAKKLVETRKLQCEGGDMFGEELWCWGEELVKGKPLTLGLEQMSLELDK